jgi:acetyl-CoA carboxylase biotin carboxyl carrier protein
MTDSHDSDDNDRRTIARLADDVVPTLIERLVHSELGELEVREDGWRIRLRRPVGPADDGASVSLADAAATRVSRASDAADRSRPTEQRPRAADRPARPERPRDLLTAVAVGYFTPRDGVTAGAAIRRGDVIGFVDVLGVRQEVVSPLDGVLRELDVEPGQAVEYGQPLGRVESSA